MKTLLQLRPLQIVTVFFLAFLLNASITQAQCTASFIAVPDTNGTGVSFISTSTGTTGSTQYFWTFGDNTTGSNSSEFHVYNSPGAYLVCLLIMDTSCQSTTCDSVIVGNAGNFCQAAFNYIVNGLNATLYNYSVGTNLNYHWDFGDGNTASSLNASHAYLLSGQYLVCLTIWNSTCSDTICSNVTVSSGTCSANFSTADSAGVTYFFATSQGTGIPSYTWDFGDGSFGTGQYTTHTYNLNSWHWACLTVDYYDTNQSLLCTTTFCDTIYTTNGGSCQASWSWSAGAAIGEIDFTDLSTATDTITGWYWDFDDGSTSTSQNPSHVYAQSGMYYVCLTITATQNGSVSCTNTHCGYIQVQMGGGGCQASFAYYDSLGTVQFYNTSTNTGVGTQYFWNFGDNSTSTVENPTHVYNSPGPFICCLTITDTALGCFSTFCDTIYTGNNTTCQASFNTVPDSTGFVYSFYNTSTGTNSFTTYQWMSSDGYSGTGMFFMHTFTTGWFQVCLTINVYDSLQNLICTSSACDSIFTGNVGAQCNANWGYQVSNFDAYFAELSTGTDTIVSWQWNFGDGSTSTLQNPVHTYLLSGYYYVCLTIETAANGVITCTDTYCQSIYAGNNNTGCQANFSMYPDSSGFGFQFQNLSTGTTGSTNYYWSFGDNTSSTQENPFHLYTTSGWFTVCLTISDSIGNCTSTICDTINVGGSAFCNPYFVWSGDTTNGVQFYQFNNNLPNMYYHWDFGDGDSSAFSDPYHQYAAVGVYYACLTVTQLDSLGFVLCTGSYCDSVYVGANAACAPQIIASPDSNSWGNGNVNFSIYSPCGNVGNATWDFGDGSTGTGSNPIHQYSATGWYWVCVDVEINGVIYTECDSVFALRLMGINDASGLSVSGLYPNPASDYINLSYSLIKTTQVNVTLYDMTGRIVRTISDGSQHAGLHKEVIDLNGISMGMYMLQVSAGGAVTNMRIVVNR